MKTEKYFICLVDVKSVDLSCNSKEECSLVLYYYNSDNFSWSNSSKTPASRERYEKAYKTIIDGLESGKKFVEIDFSQYL